MDAHQSEMMRRMHDKSYCLRNELLEAEADNEQLTYNLHETIAELRDERRRIFFPTKQQTEEPHQVLKSGAEKPTSAPGEHQERVDLNKDRRAARKVLQES